MMFFTHSCVSTARKSKTEKCEIETKPCERENLEIRKIGNFPDYKNMFVCMYVYICIISYDQNVDVTGQRTVAGRYNHYDCRITYHEEVDLDRCARVSGDS